MSLRRRNSFTDLIMLTSFLKFGDLRLRNMEKGQGRYLPNTFIILRQKQMSMLPGWTFVFSAICCKIMVSFRKSCHLEKENRLWYALVTKGDAKQLVDSFEMQNKKAGPSRQKMTKSRSQVDEDLKIQRPRKFGI